jgi:hypothetical protein
VALLLPSLAQHAPAIVHLALTALAALVAILRGEGNGTNGG